MQALFPFMALHDVATGRYHLLTPIKEAHIYGHEARPTLVNEKEGH